jgi:hypothetical protein
MTEISIPYWLKTPFIWIGKFFAFGTKKLMLIFCISVSAFIISLFVRAFVISSIARMFS